MSAEDIENGKKERTPRDETEYGEGKEHIRRISYTSSPRFVRGRMNEIGFERITYNEIEGDEDHSPQEEEVFVLDEPPLLAHVHYMGRWDYMGNPDYYKDHEDRGPGPYSNTPGSNMYGIFEGDFKELRQTLRLDDVHEKSDSRGIADISFLSVRDKVNRINNMQYSELVEDWEEVFEHVLDDEIMEKRCEEDKMPSTALREAEDILT